MFKNELKPLRNVPDSGGVRWHWSLPFTQKRRGEHARAARIENKNQPRLAFSVAYQYFILEQ